MVWATADETKKKDFTEKCRIRFKDYIENTKYKLVIFESGTKDLISETQELLKNNFKITPKQ